MTFDEIVRARRSIRRYTGEEVTDAQLTAVLEAGRLAPSAKNQQAWRFTAVRPAAMREELAAACCGQRMVAEAPVTIVVWAETEYAMANGHGTAAVDCSIATSFMMLKATDLGLGTCWLGAFYGDAVRNALGLPESAIVVAVSPLGHPAETPGARPRKPLEEIADIYR